MNKIIAWTSFVAIIFFAWWGFMIHKSASDEAKIRVKHILDEQFFDFAERTVTNDESLRDSLETHETMFTNELTNMDGFRDVSHRLFNPDEYHFIQIKEGQYLIYRGDISSFSFASSEALRQMIYDPTNGIYSEGIPARIFSILK